MRSFGFSRSLKFYFLYIVLPLLIISASVWALWLWQQSRPDKEPIVWTQLKPAAALRCWRYIVLHHSDSQRGSTAGIDRYHREEKHWDGIGYHFVIGNGYGMRNGRIEYTFRWNQQREGAHAGGNDKSYNEQGIGICMIGDFEKNIPQPFQLQRCVTLCACLIESIAALNINSIIGHTDVPGKATHCPGKHVSLANFRQMVTATLQQRRLEREQRP
jgi:N-acetyl-anhydromuramyl-L-alanine amidase AmpD